MAKETGAKWPDTNYYGKDLNTMKQLIDQGDVSISVALKHAYSYKIDDKQLCSKDLRNEYEEFVRWVCAKAKERGEKSEETISGIEGFSLDTMQALFDIGATSSYRIFFVLLGQIQQSDEKRDCLFNEEQIKFLQKNNKISSEELLSCFRSNLVSLEISLQLHEANVLSSEGLAFYTGRYICSCASRYGDSNTYIDLDIDTLEKAIQASGIKMFCDTLHELFLDPIDFILDGIAYKNLPLFETVIHLYEKQFIDANALFAYAATADNLELMSRAITEGANLKYKLDPLDPDIDNTLLSHMIENASYNSTNVILNKHNIKLLPEDILSLLISFRFAERANIFSKIYHEGIINEVLDYIKEEGLHYKANLASILLKFQLQYDSILKDLSHDELLILSNKEKVSLSDLSRSDELKNPAGFNLLQLVVIANRFDLALEMIQDNTSSINDLPPNGINFFAVWKLFGALNLYPGERNNEYEQINQAILEHVKDIDSDLGDNQTVADLLVENGISIRNMMVRTQNPLFDFFKSDDISQTINSFSQDGNIHIAITHYFKYCYDSLWTEGLLSTIRALNQKHQNIKFHLITQQNIEVGGNSLLKIFDGIIMPSGENEDYKARYKYSSDFSHLYSHMLTKAEEWGTPLFAMSSGMLNFIIHNGGDIYKVKGYDVKIHDIDFIPGTLPYFMSLSPAMQNDILTKREGLQLPKVSYKHKTQNNFAGYKCKLGAKLKLSATSEEGEAMACSSGIQITTQYYPKYDFNVNDSHPNSSHTNNLLDSYIGLVIRNHQHKKGLEEVGPLEYAKIVIDAMQLYLPPISDNNDVEVNLSGLELEM